MKAILERHGESMGNVWGGAYADDKTNFLSLRGVKQAELSAYTISELIPHEFDVVISSELTRARQTATTIMQTMGSWQRAYTIDARLNEWCFMSPGSAKWFEAEPEAVFFERVQSFYEEVWKPLEALPVTVLVVSHFYTMELLIQLIQRDLGQLDEIPSPDPYAHAGIPNAIPFYYDTELGRPPEIVLPGYHDVAR